MNPLRDEEVERKSWFQRFKDGIFGAEDDDDDVADAPRSAAQPNASASAKPAQSLRVHMARASRVAVRLNLQVIDDAQIAADGLKIGEHQIVNLEKAKPEMAERIVDFLSGVSYALDGHVQPIGNRVWMFVPANVDVDVEDTKERARAPRRSPYEDDSE